MQRHTTFRIGGPADVLIIPRDETDLQHILKVTSQNNIPLTVIGNGSNLLISDEGIDGIVIKLSGCFNDVTIQDKKITAGAGCHLSRLVRLAADMGLTGLEFAAGIPGAVGGAAVMNAGAHGMEMSNIVTKVKAIDSTGQIRQLSKSELDFGYRKSVLQGGDLTVFEVQMELMQGNPQEIKNKISSYLKKRRTKMPLNLPSAGSVFKNPQNDFAGRLIEACGCKGMRIGDAQVSELHANFIVNQGNATARDVLGLMSMVQEMVFAEYGVKLEPEIKILGREVIQESLGER